MEKIIFASITILLATPYPILAGGSYNFTVTCPDRGLVVRWNTGDIDPGKEYLRVATGTKYPGCSVTDYNPNTDKNFPITTNSHEGGIIEGIPFLGPIICSIFC